jgi:GT2 family glycosyltransferase
VRYLPELTVLHHAGQSTRQTPSRSRTLLWQNRRLFNRKHRGPLYRAAWEALVRLGGVHI